MAQSVIAAVVARYAALSMASVTKPPLWFDGVPQTGPAGTPQELPYVNLVDDGTSAEYEFEHNPIETTKLRFEVWANTLATVDLIVTGIKYGTGGITGGLGFDYATFTITGQNLMECVREAEQRHGAIEVGTVGQQVYVCTLHYHVQAQVL